MIYGVPKWQALLIAVGFLLLAVSLWTGLARAEHPPEDHGIHEAFYKKWLMPNHRNDKGERIVSCCSDQDCWPAHVVKRNDGYYALSRWSGMWVRIPDELIEQNLDDTQDPPDGRSHVCMNHMDQVLCFTHGTGG